MSADLAHGTAEAERTIRHILLDQESSGAVLTGPLGSGRRAALERAVEACGDRLSLIQLHGSRFAAGMRYGVLSFMLSRLDPSLAGNQRSLIHGLGEMLGDDDDVRTVVVLGNPQEIDPDSAIVLSQLALMRRVMLVVICERVGQIPADILSLLRSGRLSRVAFRPLNTAETREYLETELGGPVSMFAAATLRHLTAGHREVLHGLVRECVATGKLRMSAGCWVLVPGALAAGAEVGARAARILQPLSERERCVMELLAMNRSLGMADVMLGGFADAVDSLRSSGLVTLNESPLGQLVLTVPLFGHVLREGIDDDRRAELEALVHASSADARAERVRSEVHEALELGNYEAAIALNEEYRRLEGLSAVGSSPGVSGATQLLEAEVGALCITGDHARAHEVLRQAEIDLARVPGREHDPDVEVARQTVLVLRARLALLMGRHQEVPRILEAPCQPSAPADGGVWATEGLFYKALACLAESWALGEQQEDALHVAARLRTDIGALQSTGILGDIMTDDECADVHGHVLRILMTCGAWTECAALARKLLDDRNGTAHGVAYIEMVLGVLGALGGEFDAALGRLTPALRQLEVWGNPVDLAVADAAAAYCLAEQDQNSEAVKLMVASPPSDGVLLPFTYFGWATEVFTSIVLAKLHSPEAALVRLLALAEKAAESGSRLLEAHSLATALRFGRDDLAPRLLAVTEQAQGALADALHCLAEGMIEDDPQMITASLEALVDLGALMYVEEDGNLLFATLGQKERRRVTRSLARRRQSDGRRPGEGTRPLTADCEPKPPWMDRLTKREQQVTRRVVEGLSNAAIARLNGVSVRTIEGHLYQAYSKLHVRNREELTALAAGSRAEASRA